jgi:hypothetical protein
MKRVALLLWPMLFAAMVFAVYHLKGQVEQREDRLAEVHHAIQQERETIQLLRAEWSYLNQPERLRRLAASRLVLVSPAAQPKSSLGHFDRRLAEAAPVEQFTREASLPR